MLTWLSGWVFTCAAAVVAATIPGPLFLLIAAGSGAAAVYCAAAMIRVARRGHVSMSMVIDTAARNCELLLVYTACAAGGAALWICVRLLS